jgi:hypothetical protein
LGLFDYVQRTFPSGILSYYVENNNSGNIHLIVDGHGAPAATVYNTLGQLVGGVQYDIRNLGTTVPSLAAPLTKDVSGSNVTVGTSYIVV